MARILFILLLGVILFAVFRRPAREPVPVAREEAVPEWTGSEACAACHAAIYWHWKDSNHALSVRPFSDDAAARPFDGEFFVARDIEHRLGPGAEMRCEAPGGAMGTFPVDYVMGARRVQMYLTRLDGGRLQVLPVFLDVARKRWFDYAEFLFGGPAEIDVPPDSPNSWYTYARNFNSRCGTCHTTDFRIAYDADAGTYASSWSEPVVGCEACHGPGGAHVRRWRRLEPEGEDPILNAGRLGKERSNEACGYCHAEGVVVDPGFRPGDDLFAFVDLHGLEDEERVHADGRAKELVHNFLPLLQSPCGLACTDCHDPHGHERPGDLRGKLEDDRLCTQCHQKRSLALTAHTHHEAAGSGSRCIHCHMGRLVIEAGHGRVFDHTISIPSPWNTREFGVPNACAACHIEEAAGWEREPFERWFPGAEERNPRVALARTVADGRAGRPEAKEPLLALLGRPNPVYRAAAAWMLSRYDVDLRAALDDPHPLVRRAAVKGVAARHPEALEGLLGDPNPVLRRAAAMALAESYSLVRERPDLRERVLAVLEELARLRPDHDRLHFGIAALHEIAGRPAEAARSYARYLRLRPWDERTRVHAERLAKG